MDFSFLCLVLLMGSSMTVARTAPTGTQGCSELKAEQQYIDCRYFAPPPFPDNLRDASTLPAQAFVDISNRFCTTTLSATVRCFRDWVTNQSCPANQAQHLIQEAEATGGLCEGTQPSEWLQGLLDRVGDLDMSCLERHRELAWDCTSSSGSGDVDGLVDCLVRAVSNDADCSQVSLFVLFLTHPLMSATLGQTPSPQTVEKLKNLPF